MHLAGYASPWIICGDCIILFDVDLKAAKIFAEEWIKSTGEFIPSKSDNFRNHLTRERLEAIVYTIVTI